MQRTTMKIAIVFWVTYFTNAQKETERHPKNEGSIPQGFSDTFNRLDSQMDGFVNRHRSFLSSHKEKKHQNRQKNKSLQKKAEKHTYPINPEKVIDLKVADASLEKRNDNHSPDRLAINTFATDLIEPSQIKANIGQNQLIPLKEELKSPVSLPPSKALPIFQIENDSVISFNFVKPLEQSTQIFQNEFLLQPNEVSKDGILKNQNDQVKQKNRRRLNWTDDSEQSLERNFGGSNFPEIQKSLDSKKNGTRQSDKHLHAQKPPKEVSFMHENLQPTVAVASTDTTPLALAVAPGNATASALAVPPRNATASALAALSATAVVPASAAEEESILSLDDALPLVPVLLPKPAPAFNLPTKKTQKLGKGKKANHTSNEIPLSNITAPKTGHKSCSKKLLNFKTIGENSTSFTSLAGEQNLTEMINSKNNLTISPCAQNANGTNFRIQKEIFVKANETFNESIQNTNSSKPFNQKAIEADVSKASSLKTKMENKESKEEKKLGKETIQKANREIKKFNNKLNQEKANVINSTNINNIEEQRLNEKISNISKSAINDQKTALSNITLNFSKEIQKHEELRINSSIKTQNQYFGSKINENLRETNKNNSIQQLNQKVDETVFQKKAFLNESKDSVNLTTDSISKTNISGNTTQTFDNVAATKKNETNFVNSTEKGEEIKNNRNCSKTIPTNQTILDPVVENNNHTHSQTKNSSKMGKSLNKPKVKMNFKVGIKNSKTKSKRLKVQKKKWIKKINTKKLLKQAKSPHKVKKIKKDSNVKSRTPFPKEGKFKNELLTPQKSHFKDEPNILLNDMHLLEKPLANQKSIPEKLAKSLPFAAHQKPNPQNEKMSVKHIMKPFEIPAELNLVSSNYGNKNVTIRKKSSKPKEPKRKQKVPKNILDQVFTSQLQFEKPSKMNLSGLDLLSSIPTRLLKKRKIDSSKEIAGKHKISSKIKNKLFVKSNRKDSQKANLKKSKHASKRKNLLNRKKAMKSPKKQRNSRSRSNAHNQTEKN